MKSSIKYRSPLVMMVLLAVGLVEGRPAAAERFELEALEIWEKLTPNGVELIEATPWLQPIMPGSGYLVGPKLSTAQNEDAAFGFERGGTPETLTALGEKLGFSVTVVSSFLSNGEQVRSSEIRR